MGKITELKKAKNSSKTQSDIIPEEERGTLSATEETLSGFDPVAAHAQSSVGTSVEIPVVSLDEAGLPVHRELNQEEMSYYRGLIEAILFTATEPLTAGGVARKCELDRVNTRILLDTLADDFAERDSGILLREIAGGYQFLTSERYSARLRELLVDPTKRDKLTRSVMETLSIIAYRQPITLPEIEDLRGSQSRAHIGLLMQKKLIKPQGYKPVPGRPVLYVTTRQFLQRFVLNSLSELPPLEEIKELKFDELD
jgi:segregation and condensation protein B